VIAVRDHRDLFGDSAIAVVTFASQDRLAGYRRHLGLPFPLLSDTELTLYKAFGVERGTRRQVWSIGALRIYAALLLDGRRLQLPAEDVYQLGADAVVDSVGRLSYLSLPTGPERRPTVDELVEAVRRSDHIAGPERPS
jgi:hypothetical protein